MIFLLGLNIFKTRLNPVTGFTAGFVVCMCVCLLNYDKWDLDSFHFNTFCILCLGCVSFFLGCLWIYLISKRRHNVTDNSYRSFEVNKKYLIVYLIFAVCVLFYSFKYLIEVTGAENISQAALINYHAHFVEEDNSQYQLPLVPRLLKSNISYLNYYFMFILANKIVHNEPFRKIWILLSICIVSSFSGLNSGSRGSLFEPILYFFIVYICLRAKTKGFDKKLDFKKILLSFGVGILFLFLFIQAGSLFGRDTEDADIAEYIYAYVGAQPKNLDLFINETHQPNQYPGAYTFGAIYSNFVKIESLNELHIMRFIKGSSLGNVYSGFANYFYDFGVTGTIVFLFFLGIFFQSLYNLTIKRGGLRKKYFEFCIFIYAYFLQGLILNFFGERVCILFSPLFLKCIIVIYIFDFFVRRTTKCYIANQ